MMRSVYHAPERQGLETHLTYNLWPPASVRLLPAALRAIRYCRDGHGDWVVLWPATRPSSSPRYLRAREIVERLQLDRFLAAPSPSETHDAPNLV